MSDARSRTGQLRAFSWLRPMTCSLVLLAACHGDSAPRTAEQQEEGDASTVGGRVVSVVDGAPIRLDDVQRVVDALGLEPRAALRRLQRQRLLAAEARRRGLQEHPEVRRARRRAAVQALLQARVENVAIDEEAVREAYDRAVERFDEPEKRTSVHVLVRVDKDAPETMKARARALAEKALADLRAADDVQPVIDAYAKRRERELRVVAERVPPVARDASFAEPYVQAVFSLEEPGVVPQPVRTEFGWHAVAVTDIDPARKTPFHEAAQTLRAELRLKAEKKRMDALMQRLRERAAIERDKEAVRALLSRRLGAGS